jgi:hypothetical protein
MPRVEPYNVRCVAQLGQQQYVSSAELFYLPRKEKGSMVKLDRRTGATWTKKGAGEWKKLIPFGWYDVSTGSYKLMAEHRCLRDIHHQVLDRRFSLFYTPKHSTTGVCTFPWIQHDPSSPAREDVRAQRRLNSHRCLLYPS